MAVRTDHLNSGLFGGLISPYEETSKWIEVDISNRSFVVFGCIRLFQDTRWRVLVYKYPISINQETPRGVLWTLRGG